MKLIYLAHPFGGKCEELVEGGKNYCNQFGIACIGRCADGERKEDKL